MKHTFYIYILSMCVKYSANGMAIEHMKLPEINETNVNMTAHLEHSNIIKVCNNRESICKVNNTIRVCAIRKVNETFEYEDYENSCFLFLSNMCDNPGKEFYIVEAQTCAIHLKLRRHYEYSGVTEDIPEITGSPNDTSWDGNTTRPGLREFSFSTLYDVEQSHDGHICPMSCPNVYAPVCINVNRNRGKFFKFYQFVNHCEADKYYCSNWEDFAAPSSDEAESVIASSLGWSFCGASRYLQFSLFSQITSSMGHYGWLEGNYQYSKILEPWQRKPGYGK